MRTFVKKIVSVSCMVAMLLCIMTGCGNQNVDTSVNDIRTRGVLKVAVPNYDTALLYKDETVNAYRGTEAEVVDVIAQALQVSVEYVPCTKDQMLNAVLVGTADLAIGYIDEQSNSISNLGKTISYGGENLYVVSPRGVFVGNLSVLSGKTIGVSSLIDPAAYGEVYTAGADGVLLYNATSAVVDAFHNGNIAGYICYRAEGATLSEDGEFQIQSSNDLSTENFVMVTLPTKTGLLAGCNSHIKAYLEGTELPTWVAERIEKEKQEESAAQSIFEQVSSKLFSKDGWKGLKDGIF